ncbi:pirin family protein [Paenimyroides baculatum]|uniref:Quercetin 2,3-dioxygenase C-terminal cupin domain-containing protein n=1 Tax=Paenimyroides baculatum TaxID=2608000 RepID=A0A5M6CCQ1_9FLAO|nr:hypothetical protein [Paenimyroides baculatum]KAA5532934.1 hypothetical protein F0460_12880 [Paenimyroides baculatum]
MIILKNKQTLKEEDKFKRITQYFNHKNNVNSFKDISLFTDISLYQNVNYSCKNLTNQTAVLIPLVGSFSINNNNVQANEIISVPVIKNETIDIKALAEDFSYGLFFIVQQQSNITQNIDITLQQNKLSKFSLIHKKTNIYFGLYELRTKDFLTIDKKNNYMIFIISGAFEVNDRLLEAREALLIENTDLIDFEALSNNALIQIIELIT